MELDFSDEINKQKPEGFEENITNEAWAAEEKKGKKLNKPFRTSKGPKKFSVYVKNEKGNVVKVNFGDPNMKLSETTPSAAKVFALDTIAKMLAQNGKLAIGLVKCGLKKV